MWAWMQCKISFFVVCPQRGDFEIWVRSLDSGRFGEPPATTTTGCSVGLCSMRWFESNRTRSALFPSSVLKLGQSDGRGTDELFSILRRTGWCRCLRLVIVLPWLIDRDTCRRLHRSSGSLLPSCRPVHPPYSSVFSTEFNPEYGNTDLLFWLRKRSSPKYGNAHGHLNIFYGNFLLRMWRHLLEMCMLLFIMLDARPHAIHLRPRNLYWQCCW